MTPLMDPIDIQDRKKNIQWKSMVTDIVFKRRKKFIQGELSLYHSV